MKYSQTKEQIKNDQQNNELVKLIKEHTMIVGIVVFSTVFCFNLQSLGLSGQFLLPWILH